MSLVPAILEAAAALAVDPLFWLVGLSTIGIIAFSKGAVGGGAAALGVPLLSLITDPISAAIIVAPLVSFMDMFALRAFGRDTWSMPDLVLLIPGMIIGLGAGFLLFTRVEPAWVALIIGLISLVFACHWFLSGRNQIDKGAPPNRFLAMVAGATSGFTTFVAHAGGPPIAIYLMRRGLPKTVFTGTVTAYFTLGNALKLLPYGALLAERPETIAAALLLAPIVPLAVALGVKTHKRISRDTLFLATNILLVVAGGKLLVDALWHVTR